MPAWPSPARVSAVAQPPVDQSTCHQICVISAFVIPSFIILEAVNLLAERVGILWGRACMVVASVSQELILLAQRTALVGGVCELRL
jgi:hypothetical protein